MAQDALNAFVTLRPYMLYCFHCGKELGPECGPKHDPCIENCPGTSDACCGHGIVEAAYVTLDNGETLKGEAAVEYFRQHE